MEKINFINNSEPALNSTNLNKMQENFEDGLLEAGYTKIYKIAVPMTSMVEYSTDKMRYDFTKDGDFSNCVVVGMAYGKGQLVDRYQSNTDYNIGVRLIAFRLLTSQSLQGSFVVNKTNYNADLADTDITDKTYYLYVAVLEVKSMIEE